MYYYDDLKKLIKRVICSDVSEIVCFKRLFHVMVTNLDVVTKRQLLHDKNNVSVTDPEFPVGGRAPVRGAWTSDAGTFW